MLLGVCGEINIALSSLGALLGRKIVRAYRYNKPVGKLLTIHATVPKIARCISKIEVNESLAVKICRVISLLYRQIT